MIYVNNLRLFRDAKKCEAYNHLLTTMPKTELEKTVLFAYHNKDLLSEDSPSSFEVITNYSSHGFLTQNGKREQRPLTNRKYLNSKPYDSYMYAVSVIILFHTSSSFVYSSWSIIRNPLFFQSLWR